MYRGYTIEYQAPPIPGWCGVDYLFWDEDGDESVASSEEDAIVQIDLLLGEECEHLNTEDEACGVCAGSGEGAADGDYCCVCNGSQRTGWEFCIDCNKTIRD